MLIKRRVSALLPRQATALDRRPEQATTHEPATDPQTQPFHLITLRRSHTIWIPTHGSFVGSSGRFAYVRGSARRQLSYRGARLELAFQSGFRTFCGLLAVLHTASMPGVTPDETVRMPC